MTAEAVEEAMWEKLQLARDMEAKLEGHFNHLQVYSVAMKYCETNIHLRSKEDRKRQFVHLLLITPTSDFISIEQNLWRLFVVDVCYVDLEDVIVAVGQKLEEERHELEKWEEYKVQWLHVLLCLAQCFTVGEHCAR